MLSFCEKQTQSKVCVVIFWSAAIIPEIRSNFGWEQISRLSEIYRSAGSLVLWEKESKTETGEIWGRFVVMLVTLCQCQFPGFDNALQFCRMLPLGEAEVHRNSYTIFRTSCESVPHYFKIKFFQKHKIWNQNMRFELWLQQQWAMPSALTATLRGSTMLYSSVCFQSYLRAWSPLPQNDEGRNHSMIP